MGDPFLQPQTFVERLEATYGAFREAIDRMVLNTTCTCAACANISTLDLKFFVHHGTFAVQDLGGHDELVGSDVNLLHRLLKNTVVETTGIPAYALYTQAALDRLGLEEWARSLVAHAETYEHLGEVAVRIQDLAPIAEAARAAHSARIPPEDTTLENVVEIAAPVEVVWDALNDAERRRALIGSTGMERRPAGGRMGVESEFVCYHGEQVTTQEVVVYEPFRRLITHDRADLPIAPFTVLFEHELEAIEGGTRLVERFGRQRTGRFTWPLARLVFLFVVRPGRGEHLRAFKEAVEQRGSSPG